MIKTYSFSSIHPRPRLLVLGAVHGDEVCGPAAIMETIRAIENNEIKIEKGSVTFIPVCNPQAYAENRRFIDINLNRHFCRRKNPQRYEEHLMNVLAPYLENCDLLLDLHSYRMEGPPFVFRGADSKMQEEEDFASCLGVEHVVYGWRDAYMNSGVELDLEQSINTKDYARQFGGIALTLECGQHRHSDAPAHALRGIRGALHFSGICPQPDIKPVKHMKFTRLENVFFKDQQGVFLKPWKHFEKVAKGEQLARMEDGRVVTAPVAGRIIFPYETGPIGDEWMYIGIDESVEYRSYWVAIAKRRGKFLWRFARYLFNYLRRRIKRKLRF